MLCSSQIVSSSNVLWLFLLQFSFVQSSAVHCVARMQFDLRLATMTYLQWLKKKAPIVTPRRHPMFHLSNGEFDLSGRITIHCQCSIPSGFGRSVRSVAVPSCFNFPNSLFSTMSIVCFVSHFLLVLFGHGDFQRRQIGCSCFADDCFCVFSGLPHRKSRLHRAKRAFFSISSPPSTFLVRPQVL